MKNSLGVDVPKDAVQHAEFSDGVDYDLDTCNHGLVPHGSGTQLLEDLRGGEEFGSAEWIMNPWLFGTNLNAPTLDEIWPNFARGEVLSVDFSPKRMERMIAANPKEKKISREISFDDVNKIFDEVGESAAMDLMGMTAGKMLTGNPKLEKGGDYMYESIGLMMSPATLSGLTELCPFRSLQCSMMCLNDSGQGETFGGKIFNAPQEFRKKRTLIYVKMKKIFWQLIVDGIRHAIKETAKTGFKLCVRMNVLSDVGWENQAVEYKDGRGKNAKTFTAPNIFSVPEFKDKVSGYDYCKSVDRMVNFLKNRKSFPENYYLTYSLSEINMAAALWVLEHGGNVAVPFDTTANKSNTEVSRWHKLPPWWCGFKVIDADIHDMRFLDRKFFTDPKNIDLDEIECEEGECSPRLKAANPAADEDVEEKSTAYLLREKGSLNEQIICDVKRELRCGHGLVCGLRLKGTKNKTNMKLVRAAEEKHGLEFGTLTGGFVQYADWAGMIEDRTYDPSINATLSEQWQHDAVVLSEARRVIQSFAGEFKHVAKKIGGFTPYSKTVQAEISEWVMEKFGITAEEIKEKAVYLAEHLVEFEDIVNSVSKFKLKNRLWTPEIQKFLVQKIVSAR